MNISHQFNSILVNITMAFILVTSEATLAQQSIPEWVLNPTSDGLASTGCTPWSGSMNLDRQVAIANARTTLAQQIEVNVKATDTVLAEKIGNKASKTQFTSVSTQITNEALRGSKAVRVEIIDIAGKEQLCAQVDVSEKKSRQIFSNVVKTAETTLTTSEEEELYATFIGAN